MVAAPGPAQTPLPFSEMRITAFNFDSWFLGGCPIRRNDRAVLSATAVSSIGDPIAYSAP